jgi:hypothetical protein
MATNQIKTNNGKGACLNLNFNCTDVKIPPKYIALRKSKKKTTK